LIRDLSTGVMAALVAGIDARQAEKRRADMVRREATSPP
jgi:hypothetical protein